MPMRSVLEWPQPWSTMVEEGKEQGQPPWSINISIIDVPNSGTKNVKITKKQIVLFVPIL